MSLRLVSGLMELGFNFIIEVKKMEDRSKKGSSRAANGVDAMAKDEVSALARGISLLRAVASSPEGLTNKDLAELTGIPKATVSRLTSTLVGASLLRQPDESERFALGPATLHLGNSYLATYDFRQEARRYFTQLADLYEVHVHFGIRDGVEILLIDSLKPKAALILSRLDVGSRLAIESSASGRAYLASAPEAERKAALGEIRAASGKQWGDVEKRLNAAFGAYDRDGFCTSFGEWHPDINALGFCLRGARQELFAVSVGGPAYKLPKQLLLEKVVPEVQAALKEMSAAAGLP